MYPVTCRNCGELNIFATPPPERVQCTSCGNFFRTDGKGWDFPPSAEPQEGAGGLIGCLALIWGGMAFVGLVVWLDYRQRPERGPMLDPLFFYGIPAIVISLIAIIVFFVKRSR